MPKDSHNSIRNVTDNRYFSELNKYKHRVIRPIERSIKFNSHIQLSLWDYGLGDTSHVKMGLYYEIMTCSLFGGRLVDSVMKTDSADPYSNCKPDVLDGKIATESKAVRQGHKLNLLDEQIERYKLFNILRPGHSVYYAIWRHRHYHIKKGDATLDELILSLSSNTVACLVLPFSIIFSVFNGDSKNGTKRYESNLNEERKERPWPNCTRWNSGDINKFIFNPEDQIQSYGLNKEDFTFERLTIPENITFESTPVKRFPIMFIKHSKYNEWAHENIIDNVPF